MAVIKGLYKFLDQVRIDPDSEESKDLFQAIRLLIHNNFKQKEEPIEIDNVSIIENSSKVEGDLLITAEIHNHHLRNLVYPDKSVISHLIIVGKNDETYYAMGKLLHDTMYDFLRSYMRKNKIKSISI